MKKFLNENIKYIFLFLLFFFCLHVFYSMFASDQTYNYGFSYAITKGEIPYKDFNIIVPPLSPIIYTIPFMLFGYSVISFNLFQAFLLCVLFYFLFKLFDNKAWVLLIILLLPIPIPFTTLLFQGYNFLLVLEFVILMYLEKNKKSDLLIGVLLGLCVFTKQTTGFLMFFPSIYYMWKDKKRLFARFKGFLVPCFVFLFYLLFTGSFIQFWDMCLFGMFDFAGNNSGVEKILGESYFYIWMLEVIFLIYYIIKNRKSRESFYFGLLALILSTIAVPLFDYNHVGYYSFVFMIYFIDKINLKINKKIKFNKKQLGFCTYIFSLSICVTWFLFIWGFQVPNVANFNNYGPCLMRRDVEEDLALVVNFMSKNKNSILFSENTYWVKAILNEKITYYDLFNYGNHGYNGTNKLIEMLKDEEDKFIIVNMEAYNRKSLAVQFNKDVCDFVFENYEKVGEFGNYDVYYKE